MGDLAKQANGKTMTGVGAYSSAVGGKKQGNAAQGAAIESDERAKYLYNSFMSSAGDNSKQLNLLAANPQQLQALTSSLSSASQQADSDQRLLSAIDPAIMEASKQALGILKGDTAAMNAPIQAQQKEQRQQLVNSLREQYGAGAESSAIGQNALRQFDLQNNSQLAQTQQQSLSQLFGITQSQIGLNSQVGTGIQNRFNSSAQGFGQMAQNQVGAQAQGFGQMTQGMTGFGNATVGTAGAHFVSDQVQGAGKQQMGNKMMEGGSAMQASGKGGGGGGKGGGGGGK